MKSWNSIKRRWFLPRNVNL